jgi:hypothetical protein
MTIKIIYKLGFILLLIFLVVIYLNNVNHKIEPMKIKTKKKNIKNIK